MSSAEAVVQRQLEAYNAHDAAGFAATYAEDVELYDLPATGAPWLQGRAKLQASYAERFTAVPELRCDVARRSVEGPFVIDQEVCRLKPGAKPVRATAIYQVENGRIRRVWFADPRRIDAPR